MRVKRPFPGRLLGECCNLARELANSRNSLTPREFARGRARSPPEAVSVEVLDERQIGAQDGTLLGVARRQRAAAPDGISSDPPSAPAYPVLGLVGKGITFDTGGISIGPRTAWSA